jgi:GTP-binding protein
VDISGASGRDPIADFETVRQELRLYRPELAAKPQLVAANKIDAVSDEATLRPLSRHVAGLGLPFFPISAVTGKGVPDLLEAVWRILAGYDSSTLSTRAAPR